MSSIVQAQDEKDEKTKQTKKSRGINKYRVACHSIYQSLNKD
jgi:hypothetical protein